MFCVLFNYTLLRNIKDTLVVTAPVGGAEVIPFLKICGVMPCSILFFFGYVKLSNVLNRETLFYTCVTAFLAFFWLFAFILYPNQGILHPSLDWIISVQQIYPNFKYFISLYGIWSYALFYIFAELWGSIVLTLLFWQFANEITRINEAKRFYALFGLLGSVALICSGALGEWIADTGSVKVPVLTYDAWEANIPYLLSIIFMSGIGLIGIYWWMNRYVLTSPFYYDAAKSVGTHKEKRPKLSVRDSLRHLFSSKYLGCIALLVICYGVTSNIIEVTWKSQIKNSFPASNDYFAFMGRVSLWTGVTTISLIIMTKGIVRRFGWFVGAVLTPSILLVTSSIFLCLLISQEVLPTSFAFLGVSSGYLAVMTGFVQYILSKGMKYSLFDPTKEMAYIPLDQDLKVKGKAAVDVVGARVGKAGGGFIQFLLLTITSGTQLSIAPYLFGVVAVTILVWIYAVKGLSRLYEEQISKLHKKPAKASVGDDINASKIAQ